MHLLQQKIQLLAQFARAIQQFCELLQVAAQAVQFFTDVAALRKQRRLLRQTPLINGRSAEQLLEARCEAPGKSRTQRSRQPAHLLDLPPDARQPLARSEEHTSELQSRRDIVCRLL